MPALSLRVAAAGDLGRARPPVEPSGWRDGFCDCGDPGGAGVSAGRGPGPQGERHGDGGDPISDHVEGLQRVGKPRMNRRRTGKIASQPKALRDQVNVMLRDGVKGAAIASFLAEHGVPGVNSENISHWYKGSGEPEDGSGYQDWLRDQERLDQMRERREFALRSEER